MQEKRRMKVYETSYHVEHPQPPDSWCRDVRIPQIRLQGKWLAECGFLPDDEIEIEIECRNAKILLKKVKNDP